MNRIKLFYSPFNEDFRMLVVDLRFLEAFARRLKSLIDSTLLFYFNKT